MSSQPDLKNPEGGLKKNPLGFATMLYWTENEMRPGLFPNITELADSHNPKTWAAGLIYGENAAAPSPYGLYNCVDFSNGSVYGAGNNVRVLMFRGEYVFSDGVTGVIRLSRAWIKDKSLLAGQDNLGGDTAFSVGVKMFF